MTESLTFIVRIDSSADGEDKYQIGVQRTRTLINLWRIIMNQSQIQVQRMGVADPFDVFYKVIDEINDELVEQQHLQQTQE